MLFNLSKMRCKKLHWMSENIWSWHIVFTDRMSQLIPLRTSASCTLQPTLTTAANRRSACSHIHMPSDQL